MKAARIYGKGQIKVEDISIREPKDDEVQIKVKYCGLCGSDLHAYLAGWGLPTEPHPLTKRTLPVVFGHEFSGEVVKVGRDVENLKVGDPVAIEPLIACGKCENCRKGDYNFCDRVQAKDGAGNFLGFSDDGGFAEYANVKGVFAHKMPEGMSYELGALAEPASVAFEALKRSGLRAGMNVAVEGAGPVGILAAMLAKAAGASHVFVIDVAQVRLDTAKALGFKYVYNAAQENVVDKVREICPHGVDIAYEAAGVQPTFNTALKLVKRNGILQIIALFGRKIEVDLTNDVIMNGINIHTTLAYNNSYPTVLGILDNNKDWFNKVITKKIALADIVDEGIDAIAKDKTQVKILVSLEK